MEGLEISNMNVKLLFKKTRRYTCLLFINILSTTTFCQSVFLNIVEKCDEIVRHSALMTSFFHYVVDELPVGFIRRRVTFTVKQTCLAFVKYHKMIIDDEIEDYYHKDQRTINRKRLAGFSALHVAALMNKWSLVHRFVKYGANIHEKTTLYDSPLRLAIAIHAPEDVIRVLIGPNIVNVKEQGETLLQQAVNSAHWNIIPLLLRNGADWSGYLERPKPDSLILQAAMTVRKSMADGSEDYDRLGLPPVLKNYVNLRNFAKCIKELVGADNTDDNPPPSVDENLQRHFLTNALYKRACYGFLFTCTYLLIHVIQFYPTRSILALRLLPFIIAIFVCSMFWPLLYLSTLGGLMYILLLYSIACAVWTQGPAG